MTKQDIFYYAKADGIPCYYQPETEEIIPQNKLCELLMDIQIWFWDIFGTPEQFKIVVYHKAIIRQKIEKAMQSMMLKTKKENARLKADYIGLYKLREKENKGISKKIAELEAQIEKMKCCGNCGNEKCTSKYRGNSAYHRQADGYACADNEDWIMRSK